MQSTFGAPPEDVIRHSGPLLPNAKVDFAFTQHRRARTKQFAEVRHGASTFEQFPGACAVATHQTAKVVYG